MSKNYLLYSLLLVLFRIFPTHAQYGTPTLDGNISDAEYNGNKFSTTDGGTWYMTWNANYLYVGKTGGNNAEPVFLYLDLDPLLPVNGGGNLNGNLNGVNDNGVTPALPFRADTRIVSVNGNVSIQRLNSSGGWQTPGNTTDLTMSTGGTTRELRLSWATLTGNNPGTASLPATFDWLGYAANNNAGTGNYRYDLAPSNGTSSTSQVAFSGDAGGSGRANPIFPYYFTVGRTTDGNSTRAFDLRSYTFPGTGNIDSFPAIDVWDFTMNAPGQQLSRGYNGGTWNVSGSLVVSNGTVYFGNGRNDYDYGNTNVGNIRVLNSGILYMDQSSKPIVVRENVELRGGSQFRLSGAPGGDLVVGGNFLVTDGVATTQATFQPMQRAVTFTGSGASHLIQAATTGAATGYQIPFNYLTLSSPSGIISLGSDILIQNQLNFGQGLLYTNGNFVQLDGASFLNSESEASHIIGNTRITQAVGIGTSGALSFGNIGFRITPQNSSAALGDVTVTRVTGTSLAGVGTGSNSVQRYFNLVVGNSAATNLDLSLQFTYRADELNGIQLSNLSLYKSLTGAAGPFARLTSPSASTSTSLTYSYANQALATGTTFAFGDGSAPLPVTLISFAASPAAQGAALLRWATASELNNQGFTIERQLGSSTGSWLPVGTVAATGRVTGSTYEFVDKSLAAAPAGAVVYYRLRQEDHDGTTSYSQVAALARPAAVGASELVLYPVPVSGNNLSMTLAEAGQAGLEVAITNTQGQRVQHFTTQASTEQSLTVPVASLAAGVYIVSVRVPGQGVRHARFVKL